MSSENSYYQCTVCSATIAVTAQFRYRQHIDRINGKRCLGSGVAVPRQLIFSPAEAEAEEDQFAFVRDEPKTQSTEMTPLGQEIATRLKELFYSYTNRHTDDNRAAQKHLGPSEIGTECDRRLAMSISGHPPTNPGGDGWAAFVGTCMHAGLADMFTWANHDTGRYEVEMPLTFPSDVVPKGTGDLLDRTAFLFLDHKGMGSYSLKKLASEGPSQTYRVQVHTYAWGASMKGEQISNVAIIGWPRDKSTLDSLYVWTEEYKPQVARDAVARVDDIDLRLDRGSKLSDFDKKPGYECRYCPFYLPGDTREERGCCG